MKNKKVIIAIILILVIAAVSVNAMTKRASFNDAMKNMNSEIEYTVKREDISMSVAESGNVNPVDKRIIKSEINGTVDGIYITEGDLVDKNQMLVSLKSNTSSGNQTEINSIRLNIEKTQRELNDLYKDVGDLNIYAPVAGVISNFNIKVGDQVNSSSNIATIKDTDNSYIEVYFTKEQFDKISLSDSASIFMTRYFSTESGTVAEKNSTPVQMGGGTFGYLVTVKMKNPGGYSVGDLTQITVNNSQGSFQGMSNGKIVDVREEKVTSNLNGKISSINVENGKYVNKGDVIATIEGDDLSLQIAEKQNAIAKYNTQIEDLVEGSTVYAPMKGTVLKINVSDEEVVDRTTTLMTIADLDNMEVTIAVDELDITKIKQNQTATLTSDVFPNENFTGTVTKISMEGTSQNGVTTYDVTVKLDDRKSLMSGMNVDVEILSDRKENVIVIPIEAVQKLNGDYMVTVKDSSGNKNDVKVELGLATKDKVEITSGLKDGDVVIYTSLKNSNAMTPYMGMPGVVVEESPGGGRGQEQRPEGTRP